ncbi:TolC family protein [Myxococcus sp. RHSTA-1-4]|uniref:TolC family protein n=1 Tax=Myxococcus sp. RHSTA-1-4 TaxID=2874601 RepID=UPI001CBA9869|nr:TolC family protein [Myxococcus sp. RHSTA-1-4]MBZ4420199.1 TolC family protein [Myxococcus sp. RHSTA-1-4]
MLPFLLISLVAATPDAPPPLELEALLAEVSTRAPQIQAQQAAAEVARSRIGVEGAWEDPTVELMAESIPLRGGEDAPMPMLTWRFTQPLNVFGRRGLAKEAARAQLQAEQARTRRVGWDVRTQAVAVFLELWMNQEMRALLDRQIATLERMKDAAKARYVAGMMMGHHDFLRAQAELAAMEAEKASLDSEREAMAAMLNALRGRPLGEPVGEIVLPGRGPLPDVEALLARAEERPELEAMRWMRAEMETRRTLAQRMYLPMPMVSGFYEQRTGGMPDSVGGIVGLTVPLWWFDRQRNEVRMAEAMVQRAQRDLEAMEVMTRTDLRMAWSRARAADLTLQALEDTALPRMRETVAASESAYVSGSADFLSLLEATMARLRLEADRLQAVVRREVARYELERLLGASIAPEEKP